MAEMTEIKTVCGHPRGHHSSYLEPRGSHETDPFVEQDGEGKTHCGHPRGCIVQGDGGTAHRACGLKATWCEEVARLREELEQVVARKAMLVKAANALIRRLAAVNLEKPEATALGNALAYGPEVTVLQDVLAGDDCPMPCNGCETVLARDEDCPLHDLERLRVLIPDLGMLHRLTYAAGNFWEGGGEQAQKDIAAGYALVEKLRAAEEANVDET